MMATSRLRCMTGNHQGDFNAQVPTYLPTGIFHFFLSYSLYFFSKITGQTAIDIPSIIVSNKHPQHYADDDGADYLHPNTARPDFLRYRRGSDTSSASSGHNQLHPVKNVSSPTRSISSLSSGESVAQGIPNLLLSPPIEPNYDFPLGATGDVLENMENSEWQQILHDADKE